MGRPDETLRHLDRSPDALPPHRTSHRRHVGCSPGWIRSGDADACARNTGLTTLRGSSSADRASPFARSLWAWRGCRGERFLAGGRSGWGRRCGSRRRGRPRSRWSRRNPASGRRPVRRSHSRHRKERQRVEVPLRVGGPPDAQMDVGHGQLGLAARADGADVLALRDRTAPAHRVRPQVDERDGISVSGLDRHRLALSRDRSHERDRARGGRHNRDPSRRTDVDASVLPRVVGTALVEGEERQDGPVDRPAPSDRRCRGDQGGKRSQCDEQAHLEVQTSVVNSANLAPR